jgi:hypothetical protein
LAGGRIDHQNFAGALLADVCPNRPSAHKESIKELGVQIFRKQVRGIKNASAQKGAGAATCSSDQTLVALSMPADTNRSPSK